MKENYIAFVSEHIKNIPKGDPIYTGRVAEDMATRYSITVKAAAAATAVAVKRIMDGGLIPELIIEYQ